MGNVQSLCLNDIPATAEDRYFMYQRHKFDRTRVLHKQLVDFIRKPEENLEPEVRLLFDQYKDVKMVQEYQDNGDSNNLNNYVDNVDNNLSLNNNVNEVYPANDQNNENNSTNLKINLNGGLRNQNFQNQQHASNSSRSLRNSKNRSSLSSAGQVLSTIPQSLDIVDYHGNLSNSVASIPQTAGGIGGNVLSGNIQNKRVITVTKSTLSRENLRLISQRYIDRFGCKDGVVEIQAFYIETIENLDHQHQMIKLVQQQQQQSMTNGNSNNNLTLNLDNSMSHSYSCDKELEISPSYSTKNGHRLNNSLPGLTYVEFYNYVQVVIRFLEEDCRKKLEHLTTLPSVSTRGGNLDYNNDGDENNNQGCDRDSISQSQSPKRRSKTTSRNQNSMNSQNLNSLSLRQSLLTAQQGQNHHDVRFEPAPGTPRSIQGNPNQGRSETQRSNNGSRKGSKQTPQAPQLASTAPVPQTPHTPILNMKGDIHPKSMKPSPGGRSAVNLLKTRSKELLKEQLHKKNNQDGNDENIDNHNQNSYNSNSNDNSYNSNGNYSNSYNTMDGVQTIITDFNGTNVGGGGNNSHTVESEIWGLPSIITDVFSPNRRQKVTSITSARTRNSETNELYSKSWIVNGTLNTNTATSKIFDQNNNQKNEPTVTNDNKPGSNSSSNATSVAATPATDYESDTDWLRPQPMLAPWQKTKSLNQYQGQQGQNNDQQQIATFGYNDTAPTNSNENLSNQMKLNGLQNKLLANINNQSGGLCDIAAAQTLNSARSNNNNNVTTTISGGSGNGGFCLPYLDKQESNQQDGTQSDLVEFNNNLGTESSLGTQSNKMSSNLIHSLSPNKKPMSNNPNNPNSLLISPGTKSNSNASHLSPATSNLISPNRVGEHVQLVLNGIAPNYTKSFADRCRTEKEKQQMQQEQFQQQKAQLLMDLDTQQSQTNIKFDSGKTQSQQVQESDSGSQCQSQKSIVTQSDYQYKNQMLNAENLESPPMTTRQWVECNFQNQGPVTHSPIRNKNGQYQIQSRILGVVDKKDLIAGYYGQNNQSQNNPGPQTNQNPIPRDQLNESKYSTVTSVVTNAKAHLNLQHQQQYGTKTTILGGNSPTNRFKDLMNSEGGYNSPGRRSQVSNNNNNNYGTVNNNNSTRKVGQNIMNNNNTVATDPITGELFKRHLHSSSSDRDQTSTLPADFNLLNNNLNNQHFDYELNGYGYNPNQILEPINLTEGLKESFESEQLQQKLLNEQLQNQLHQTQLQDHSHTETEPDPGPKGASYRFLDKMAYLSDSNYSSPDKNHSQSQSPDKNHINDISPASNQNLNSNLKSTDVSPAIVDLYRRHFGEDYQPMGTSISPVMSPTRNSMMMSPYRHNNSQQVNTFGQQSLSLESDQQSNARPGAELPINSVSDSNGNTYGPGGIRSEDSLTKHSLNGAPKSFEELMSNSQLSQSQCEGGGGPGIVNSSQKQLDYDDNVLNNNTATLSQRQLQSLNAIANADSVATTNEIQNSMMQIQVQQQLHSMLPESARSALINSSNQMDWNEIITPRTPMMSSLNNIMNSANSMNASYGTNLKVSVVPELNLNALHNSLNNSRINENDQREIITALHNIIDVNNLNLNSESSNQGLSLSQNINQYSPPVSPIGQRNPTPPLTPHGTHHNHHSMTNNLTNQLPQALESIREVVTGHNDIDSNLNSKTGSKISGTQQSKQSKKTDSKTHESDNIKDSKDTNNLDNILDTLQRKQNTREKRMKDLGLDLPMIEHLTKGGAPVFVCAGRERKIMANSLNGLSDSKKNLSSILSLDAFGGSSVNQNTIFDVQNEDFVDHDSELSSEESEGNKVVAVGPPGTNSANGNNSQNLSNQHLQSYRLTIILDNEQSSSSKNSSSDKDSELNDSSDNELQCANILSPAIDDGDFCIKLTPAGRLESSTYPVRQIYFREITELYLGVRGCPWTQNDLKDGNGAENNNNNSLNFNLNLKLSLNANGFSPKRIQGLDKYEKEERVWLFIRYKYSSIKENLNHGLNEIQKLKDHDHVNSKDSDSNNLNNNSSTPERSPERELRSPKAQTNSTVTMSTITTVTTTTVTHIGCCGLKFCSPRLRDMIVNAILASNGAINISGSVV